MAIKASRGLLVMLVAFCGLALFLPDKAGAERVPSLIERIESAFEADRAFTDEERALYLKEFRRRLAAYGRDILRDEKALAADVLMSIVMEGSFDGAPVERTVEVATAAYIAISRGSDPEVVEGIALYGFRKQLSADQIEAWANGYGQTVKFGVPPHVAEDLVYQAAQNDWDIYTFNKFKWGLVEAAKEGYDLEDFQAYTLGHFLKDRNRPGTMVSRSLRYFRNLDGSEPEIPPYEGSFIPRKHPGAVPEPELDLTRKKPEATPIPGPDIPPVKPPKSERPSAPVPEKRVEKKPEPEKQAPAASPPSVLGYLIRLESSYKSYLGVPYAWGGTTRRGMDCSGFVQRVFGDAGIRLPRTSREQWMVGETVTRNGLKKGDLVFFRTVGKRISHVGIMTEPGKVQFVHASSSKGVSFALLSWRYFDKRYAGARRILPERMATWRVDSFDAVARLDLYGRRQVLSSVF